MNEKDKLVKEIRRMYVYWTLKPRHWFRTFIHHQINLFGMWIINIIQKQILPLPTLWESIYSFNNVSKSLKNYSWIWYSEYRILFNFFCFNFSFEGLNIIHAVTKGKKEYLESLHKKKCHIISGYTLDPHIVSTVNYS